MIGCGGLWSVLMKSSGTTELNDFYPIRPECQSDVPTTRFKPRVRFFGAKRMLCYNTLYCLLSIV